jgi:tetratricopeptide (TPR) repeat protein
MINVLRSHLAGLLLCATTLLSVSAHAQEVKPPDEQAARDHHQRGVTLYYQKQYEEALREFSIANDLRPRPAFLFNIGRCQEQLERWRDAADSFSRYLDSAPDLEPSERDELRARIVVLRSRAQPARESSATATTTATATNQPSTRAAVDTRRPRLRLGATLVGVAAGLTAIAATTLVLTVGPEYKQLENTCRLRQCGPSDTAGLRARLDAGYALWAVAGAAAVTDLVLWIAATRHPSQQRAFLAPGVGGFTFGSNL